MEKNLQLPNSKCQNTKAKFQNSLHKNTRAPMKLKKCDDDIQYLSIMMITIVGCHSKPMVRFVLILKCHNLNIEIPQAAWCKFRMEIRNMKA